MMYFYFKCTVFLWVINSIWIEADNVTLVDLPECAPELFGVTDLGYSSLLINWHRNEIKQKDTKDLLQFLSYPDNGNSMSKLTSSCYRKHDQCKIASLKENTSYRIELENECWIVGKTSVKTDYSFPTKPDFKFTIETSYSELPLDIGFRNIGQPLVRIEWLPCGEKGYCEKEEVAGSHFYIKYKMLYSRQEWRIYEYDKSNKYIYGFLPGRPYEVVVTSVSAGDVNFETDSDPQEIFIMPSCSSVRSVKIITLTNSSVYISWKTPEQCQGAVSDKDINSVIYSKYDSSPIILLNYSQGESPYAIKLGSRSPTDDPSFSFVQVKITHLIPGTRYTFYIIPWVSQPHARSPGFEYRIDYTPETYQVNLPLAKPEFTYELSNKDCTLEVWWLPCGHTYDCENTKPGSYFLLRYRNMIDGSAGEKIETDSDSTAIKLHIGKKYKLSVESRDEYNNSKSSRKTTIGTSKCKGKP